MLRHGFILNTIVQNSDKIKHISKDNLGEQDYLIVKTSNSLYTIKKVDEKLYEISGGWFDKKGLSPSKMIIRGCTWGGSVIHINMLAACGLCLEFGNNVITSPVNQIIVIRGGNLN
jgi:hypothetical protein